MAVYAAGNDDLEVLGGGGGGGGLNVTIMKMCITCMMSWLSLVPRDFIVRYQCVGKISRQFFIHIEVSETTAFGKSYIYITKSA